MMHSHKIKTRQKKTFWTNSDSSGKLDSRSLTFGKCPAQRRLRPWLQTAKVTRPSASPAIRSCPGFNQKWFHKSDCDVASMDAARTSPWPWLMEEHMSNVPAPQKLLTVSDIATRLGVTRHVVTWLVVRLAIAPQVHTGNCRQFNEDAVQLVGAALAKRRRARRPGAIHHDRGTGHVRAGGRRSGSQRAPARRTNCTARMADIRAYNIAIAQETSEDAAARAVLCRTRRHSRPQRPKC
jgi:hypothetical protein